MGAKTSAEMVTVAGTAGAAGSHGVAAGAGCGLGAAFWIGSSGPGMSNGMWGEWMGPARSGETELVGGLGSEGQAGLGSNARVGIRAI
ncbi:hypothetical protein CLOP_g22327 [Closterium sp. NIES-67]|nr:hypothetical protein CLOP_g22327 [Closterium sp. NIES-67]